MSKQPPKASPVCSSELLAAARLAMSKARPFLVMASAHLLARGPMRVKCGEAIVELDRAMIAIDEAETKKAANNEVTDRLGGGSVQ